MATSEYLDKSVETRVLGAFPKDVEFASVRLSAQRGESLAVRRGVLDPINKSLDSGAMVTVWNKGGQGYAATSDLSESGLSVAFEIAKKWAEITAGRSVIATNPVEPATGTYVSPVEQPWEQTTLKDRIELLKTTDAQLGVDDRIVDWGAELSWTNTDTLILTSGGSRIEQSFRNTYPQMYATANDGSNTQTRTFGGWTFAGQGGRELLANCSFQESAPRIVSQVLELLAAQNCPSGTMDVVLAPDQMILQIHESIGHPLELDRILGDERNYAGTSFVTLDMFGSYQYGSPLLNVTFDPNIEGQLASYKFDDDGTPATKQFLIKEGILQRPLGGVISQARAKSLRADIQGVANSRACSWNRPPIDRMANLNVEPGELSFDELIGGVERGVYLETNNSWSIDDSRNKFQFGCEYGRLIVDGKLGPVIRNPSYRGISATFWRSLSGVGNADLFKVMGTPNCGKGEPSQMIGTGHASPPCRFSDVEVFGAEQ